MKKIYISPRLKYADLEPGNMLAGSPGIDKDPLNPADPETEQDVKSQQIGSWDDEW